MIPNLESVDDYIALQPAAARKALEQVRRAIRKAIPKADEMISYKIPAYKLDGHAVLFFAGWKQHFSLYPASRALVEEFQDDLAPYKVNKGTIRFPLSEPVPVKLIERIAKFRAQEVAGRDTSPPKRKLKR
jgi:uncharacterized protein YdhG (YjbR/CyaY superfamily)